MLYPMFALVMFTFLFVTLHFILRVSAVKNGKVRARYFKLFQNVDGQDIPDYITAGQKHFANLFETPVLFYVAGVLAIVLNLETPMMQFLGWTYVLLRIVHAYIHCTYNHILHRLIAFWLSLVVLLLMWVNLL